MIITEATILAVADNHCVGIEHADKHTNALEQYNLPSLSAARGIKCS